MNLRLTTGGGGKDEGRRMKYEDVYGGGRLANVSLMRCSHGCWAAMVDERSGNFNFTKRTHFDDSHEERRRRAKDFQGDSLNRATE